MQRHVIEIKFVAFRKFSRTRHKLAVRTRGHSDMRIKTDRARQHKACVVVRVLANQIHASRRIENFRLGVKFFLETLKKIAGAHEVTLL